MKRKFLNYTLLISFVLVCFLSFSSLVSADECSSNSCYCTEDGSNCLLRRDPRGDYVVRSDMSKCGCANTSSVGSSDDLDFCVTTSAIWQFVGYALFVLKIAIPLLIIILAIIDLVKAIMSSDDSSISKAGKTLGMRLITGIAIYFIPLIVSVIFGFIKESAAVFERIDACQVCLLNPINESCQNYKERAKEERDNRNNQSQQGSSTVVKVEKCYFCNDTQEYKWTEETLRNCTIVNEYETESECLNGEIPSYNEPSGGGTTGGNTGGTTGGTTTPGLVGGSEKDYANSPIEYVPVSAINCKIDFSVPKEYIEMNELMKDALIAALNETCAFLSEYNNIYKIDYIMSAGTYNPGSSVSYPHYYAMGIDLFNNWSYTDEKTGKTYYPYSNYGAASEAAYNTFVCEVCKGIENCHANLNYQIYERFFKPLGFCWGGYWGTDSHDPMHFEISRYENGMCATRTQRITCS